MIFNNMLKNNTQLVVGCHDGSIRIHSVENGMTTGNIPDMVQLPDYESPVDLVSFQVSQVMMELKYLLNV
jgi:hypothetical protein